MNTVQFKAVFQKMWEEAQSEVLFEPIEITRLLEVHPSQIPICPMSFILGFYPDVKMQRTSKMISNCILNTGSAVHRSVQDFLGLSPYAFGNFVCRECGEIFELTTGGECPNGCGVPLRYEEVGINYKGFAGHVDFMVKVKDEIWLVDFKTSSQFSLDKKVKNTPENYNLQTLAYALLLRLQYGLKIKGRAIGYISRDNPSVLKLGGCKAFTKKDFKYIQTLLKEQRELLNFLLDCKTYKEFMENVGIQRCSNQYCSCCSGKHTDDELKALLKQKFKEMGGKSIRDYVNTYLEEKQKTENLIESFVTMCKGDRNESES